MENQQDLSVFNDLEIDLNIRKSIAYAKARSQIEGKTLSRHIRRYAKIAVVEVLGGTVYTNEEDHKHKKDSFGNNIVRKSVLFPDGSEARF